MGTRRRLLLDGVALAVVIAMLVLVPAVATPPDGDAARGQVPVPEPGSAPPLEVPGNGEPPGRQDDRSSPDVDERVADLPEPYASWNVTVQVSDWHPQGLEVAFDSELLGQRAHNFVWLPDSYSHKKKQPSGTVYFLHGTTCSYGCPAEDLDSLDSEPTTPVWDQLQTWEFAPRGGYYVGAHGLNTFLHRHQYVSVVLDAGPEPHWCGHCWWVDGRDGTGIQAESHLYEELIPVVEALFNVRTDRGGRGIVGHSMGGSGALIQGMRHPDRWGYIGSTGATVVVTRPFTGGVHPEWMWLNYLRQQGFDVHDEIAFRSIDPFELATNLSGQNIETLMVLGDGCNPDDPENPCHDYPDDPNAVNAVRVRFWDIEGKYRFYSEAASAKLAELGVPHQFVKRTGTHVGLIRDTYDRLMIDQINRVFARDVPVPTVFSYKTTETDFDVWDYAITVERPNEEFLNLLAARTDGTDFVLAGTGTVTVSTPAAFEPHRSYTVLITPEDGTTREVSVSADAQGRLHLELDLGPTRAVDERLALVEAGEFSFPHTRVQVL
ncbi:MAG TPA: alpha/beta hydrolase-fold protein [Nitriliruptorales bacterium]